MIPISHYSFEDIIGFNEIKGEAKNLAIYDIDILILGETGVGKGILASAIHNISKRKSKGFGHIDCAIIPPNLFESELFGYKKGAFTDAKNDKIGKIEHFNQGTIFLDEIGEIPLNCQAKILRLIEEKEFYPVGGNQSISVDIRFIFATNRNLISEINNKNFRMDLYYRINSHVIKIPPLREKKSEIPKICMNYWSKLNNDANLNLEPLNKREIDILSSYNFPGNIRELLGVLKRIYIKFSTNHKVKREILIQKEIEKLTNTNALNKLTY